MLVHLKKTDEYSWLNSISHIVLISSLYNLDKAYQNFFKGRARYPRVKKKYRGTQSIQFPKHPSVYLIGEEFIKIPKIGQIPINLHRSFDGKMKTVTLKKTPTNKYFVSILVDDGKPLLKIKPAEESLITGIDLGIKDLVILSDGTKIPNHRHTLKYAAKLIREQKSLSRKQIGSKRYGRQRLKVAKVHEKIANSREDTLHKASTKIVDESQAVILEDLNVQGMLRNGKLAKHIQDCAWSEFTRKLEYKCQWNGKPFVKIDRWFPSSKTCSDCGSINSELTLDVREWQCANCGSSLDRDVNAAKNIRAEGLKVLREAGDVFQVTPQSDRKRGDVQRWRTEDSVRETEVCEAYETKQMQVHLC